MRVELRVIDETEKTVYGSSVKISEMFYQDMRPIHTTNHPEISAMTGSLLNGSQQHIQRLNARSGAISYMFSELEAMFNKHTLKQDKVDGVSNGD